uniref:hypothetical protein n=1 Tax=Streptomyces polyasparticus TaxID=2767826 RepID=UPI00280C1D02|nr:hypothetical protein [Streptomyces polyasparticus]
MEGDLPRREDLGRIFGELDFQPACQAYLWALPLVSYAQWQKVHREVFGAGPHDLVHYVDYRDRLGLITATPPPRTSSASSTCRPPAPW